MRELSDFEKASVAGGQCGNGGDSGNHSDGNGNESGRGPDGEGCGGGRDK